MILWAVERTVLTATLYNRIQADWACCWRKMSYFSIYHPHESSCCFGPSFAESRHFSGTGLLTKLRTRQEQDWPTENEWGYRGASQEVGR